MSHGRTRRTRDNPRLMTTETTGRLRQIADTEGGEMFMGWPDRWWADAHWRCAQDHVSTSVLRSEALGRDACLACRSPIALTFPEDRDGPLPDA